jgi:hypothetical protein
MHHVKHPEERSFIVGPKFKCPVTIVDSKGKRKKCGRKFATLEAMLQHADRAHGGRGREL